MGVSSNISVNSRSGVRGCWFPSGVGESEFPPTGSRVAAGEVSEPRLFSLLKILESCPPDKGDLGGYSDSDDRNRPLLKNPRHPCNLCNPRFRQYTPHVVISRKPIMVNYQNMWTSCRAPLVGARKLADFKKKLTKEYNLRYN